MAGQSLLEVAELDRTTGVGLDAGEGRAKRAFDVVVALALLVVAIPLVLLLALGVAVTLRTSPFFTQTRVGRHGRHFRFVKLRTLPTRTPAYADKYEISKIRTPAFCRFLRKTHLDELPQLLLVLKGDMSLVGPRPDMPQLHADLPATHRQVREALRPGCTGIWQVSVDNDRLIGEAPVYDHHYWLHTSVRMDVWVLWRTLLLVLGSRQVTLSDVPAWALAETYIDLTDATPSPVLVEPALDRVAYRDAGISLGGSAAS